MSHIKDQELLIQDLDALETVAPRLGLEFRRNQTHHAWFERFVGDTTPPAWLKPDDYGKCAHALRLKDHRKGEDYEIGLYPVAGGYKVVFDEWGPGRRLMEAVGPNCNGLRREYAAAVAIKRTHQKLAHHGFTVQREDMPGSKRIRLRLVCR